MKLKHRASLAIFVLGLLLLALLAGSVGYYHEQQEERAALARLETHAQELATRLNKRIDRYVAISTTLAQSPEIRKALSDSNSAFTWLDPSRRQLMIEQLSGIWAGQDDPSSPFVLERTDNAVARHLARQIEAFPNEYKDMFLTNEFGVTIAATSKLPALVHAHQPWWIASHSGKGRLVLVDKGYDSNAHGYLLGVVLPVIDSDRVAGVLRADINIQAEIGEMIDRFNETHEMDVKLVRANGQVAYEQGSVPLSTKINAALGSCLSQHSTTSTIASVGETFLAACTPIDHAIRPDEHDLDSEQARAWSIVVLQQRDSAIANSQQITMVILVTGLVIILFASILAWLLGSASAKPIERLARLAARISDGELEIKADASTNDAPGQLAESINRMAEKLKSSLTSRDEVRREVERRKEAEKQLLFLSTSVEQAKEAISITNTEGIIEYINPAFTELTGYSKQEAIGQSQGILKSGVQSSRFYEKMWADIQSGSAWSGRIENRHKDGDSYPAMMTISPITNADGKVTHFVSTQLSLKEFEELEKHLRQTQKMEAVGVLVGGIAHDFNNMLAGIIGNLYLAKRKADTPYMLSKLENIESLSFRASSMIKRLLTFARKDMVEMKPFGLTSFIKETSKLNRASIPENITFNIDLCEKELLVYGDPTQLQQVIINLLSNAYDAVADAERPEITLKLEEFTANQELYAAYPDIDGATFAHLIVEDNGCGISDADKEHIFEPFFTTKEVGSGSGLGLAMVYGSIKSHGGAIKVDNTSGQGVAFHIYLPIFSEDEVLTPQGDTTQVQQGRGETILIADDNEVVRHATREVLETIGYRVLEAIDGADAVSQFTANKDNIALIIMDVVMPRLSGAEAVKRIKETSPDVKVIYATGYNKDEILEKDIQDSKCPVLTKPFVIENLSRLVRQQLDG